MDVQSAYHEESTRLKETLEEVRQQLAGIGPRYYGNDFVEQLLDAKREESRERLQLLEIEPYFGRLDFHEKGKDGAAPLYIGKRGMEKKETGQPYIIDWRAPVASLFYSFTGGDEPVEYEAPEGIVGGEIHLKRNLSIREQVLQRVVDSYVRGGDNLGLSDEFLLYRLGEKKDNRLRDIVSTIQAEQDQIIRAPRARALIIQGAAGSGKTTVALHRLAFLLYQYQDQVRADRMIIFAPNTMFLDYISGVLPELGVGNVRQTTFTDWALELLGDEVRLAEDDQEGKRWFSLEAARPEEGEWTSGRYKGSMVFKELLAGWLREYEQFYLPELDFEPWEGGHLPYRTLREWFEVEYRPYPLAARRDRLVARLNRWLEMELGKIADPKKRKERSKTGKQRLRTFLKKLPEVTALQLYRRFFGVEASPVAAAEGIPQTIAEQTKAGLKKGVVRQEDLAALCWIHRQIHAAEGRMLDHIVVDEAQDISPLQVELYKSFMNEPSFTILGDLAQGIHAYRGIHRWEELSELFKPEQTSYHELKQSYRSTLEIIEFANTILPYTDTGLPAAQPVFRSGEPVEVVRCAGTDERDQRVRSYIEEQVAGGMRTVAVICRTDEECRSVHGMLEREGVEVSLILEGQQAYKGGVSVVPVYMAKGLEFDAVLLPDVDEGRYTASPADAKLLYVGCTRALHRLTLLHIGEASPLLG
ncbi:DNA helicase UvrD [Paenibacillus sambharensis]|uniref:DNA helicase UvrD n=1 Tax=Paenibacillus sambharensis TaxID=1803190 RepID=A0A2W1LFK0_9BACL|nr:3'-5' exonuclease [Paenibacillus sambharensis]PZD93214.1 DNA helicase UvrD [Paenibacillus sambharensis]